MSKDTFFNRNFQINCRGNLVDLTHPVVMGIINTTPDSFFSQSRVRIEVEILNKVEGMMKAGATFIDIGGCSTRPGAKDPGEKEERQRLIPAIKDVVSAFPECIISVDTYRSRIAKEAIQAGASLINDVSGGEFDKDMFETVAELNVPYILMHKKGTPDSMQNKPYYENVVNEVLDYLKEKVLHLKSLGVKDVILDPGFGFGKNLEHNFRMLKNLDTLSIFELPVLVGLSRKSMVTRLLEVNADEALTGSTILHTIALLKGAQILRVHDIYEAMQVIKTVSYYKSTV